MVVAQATIMAFLGVAFIFFWVAFQLGERHDILKGLMFVVGLIMLVLTLSITQHFIEADAVVNSYSGEASYGKLIGHATRALTSFIWMIYVIIAYVVIYNVFFVIVPISMDWAMGKGYVKKNRKKERKKQKRIEREENDNY